MARKYEYVGKNIKVIRELIKSGDLSTKIISDFQIYERYKGYSSIKSKMKRYQFTADDFGTSTIKVMRAVKDMESQMPKLKK